MKKALHLFIQSHDLQLNLTVKMPLLSNLSDLIIITMMEAVLEQTPHHLYNMKGRKTGMTEVSRYGHNGIN